MQYEKKERSKIYGKNDKAVVVTHAALIIENGSCNQYDALIVVTCSYDIQIARVMQRDNILFALALIMKIKSNRKNQLENLCKPAACFDNLHICHQQANAYMVRLLFY